MRCNTVIDMEKPTRSEQVRGFQPPWRTVFVYECPRCTKEWRLRASSFIGTKAVPGVGGIICGNEVKEMQP